MTLTEARKRNPIFDFELHASDIAKPTLMTAKEGKYSGRTIDHLMKHNPLFLSEYFQKVGEEYQIKEGLRNSIRFFQHNLLRTPQFSEKLDLILLRNVLIYFNEIEQAQTLDHMKKALKPGGILIIGESESLSRLNTGFEFIEPLIYGSPLIERKTECA